MEATNPTKRLRQNLRRGSSSTSQIQSQNPNVPSFNQNHVDVLISSLLSLPDFPWLSPPYSIGSSFDQAFERLFEASGDDSVQDRGLQLTSLLHESAKRCSRKRATLHNTHSWRLPPELTFELITFLESRVFSMLDTKSLMQASACCTVFSKCAMDPLCYSHIDLTTCPRYADDGVLSTMIHRAGKELRSLEVGCPDESTTSSLTTSCFAPLSYQHSLRGKLLKSLHIYDPTWLNYDSLSLVLSACSNLTSVMIVGLDGDQLDDVLYLLPDKCEELYIERKRNSDNRFFHYISSLQHSSSFIRECPNITSLSLINFDITDEHAYILITGLRKLKYMNLSRTHGIDGSFLRDARHEDILLETLILRDCIHLKESSVCRFLKALVRGHCEFIRHIDVSIEGGLLYGDRRSCRPELPLEELENERPGLEFVADFTSPPSPYSRSPSPRYTSSSSGSDHYQDYEEE